MLNNGGSKQNIWNPKLHKSHSNNLSSSPFNKLYDFYVKNILYFTLTFFLHILHGKFSNVSSHSSMVNSEGFIPRYPKFKFE